MSNAPVHVCGFELFSANSELIYDETFKFKGLILAHTTKKESMIGFENTNVLFGASDALRKAVKQIHEWSLHAEHLNREFLTDGEEGQMRLNLLDCSRASRSMDWNYARLSEPGGILHGAPSPFEILSTIGKSLDLMQTELRLMKSQ